MHLPKDAVMADYQWPEVFFLPVWKCASGWSICIHDNMIFALDNVPDALRVMNSAREANRRVNNVVEGSKVGDMAWSIREVSRAELFEEVKHVRVPIQYLVTRLTGDKMLLMDLTSRNRPAN